MSRVTHFGLLSPVGIVLLGWACACAAASLDPDLEADHVAAAFFFAVAAAAWRVACGFFGSGGQTSRWGNFDDFIFLGINGLQTSFTFAVMACVG